MERKNEKYNSKGALLCYGTNGNQMLFRPKASEVLTVYLKQTKEPPWTSYFVKYQSVKNDQFGESHFNWQVNDSNYHVLRTGCFPYIKYHCTKRPKQDLTLDNALLNVVKVMNLGIPNLIYGLSAISFITHKEAVYFPNGKFIYVYFLLKEDAGSQF